MATDPWGARPASPPPAAEPRAADPVRLPPRGRPALIALVALVSALVLVAAFGNQAVSKEVVKAARDTNNETLRDLLGSVLTFTWRFSAGGILRSDRYWASQLLLIGVLLVVTFLLTLSVVRGAITFWRAFFGTWMAVVVATLLGSVAANLVYDPSRQGKPRTVAQGIWSPTSADAFAFVGALGLGLVVALVTALVAVASRRSGEVIVPATDDRYPDRFGGRPDGRWDDRYGPEPAAPPPYSPDDSATRQLPSLRKEEHPEEGRGSSAWPTAAAAGIGAGAGAAAVHEHERNRDRDRATQDENATRDDPRRETLEEPTQAHPVVDDQPTQAHPVAGPDGDEPTQAHPVVTDEPGTPARHDEPIPTNQTVQLPRFEPGKEPWNQPGGVPAPEAERPTDLRADTNELPRADPGPRFPGSDPNAPQQTHFPRPPNDEELGHDHTDD